MTVKEANLTSRHGHLCPIDPYSKLTLSTILATEDGYPDFLYNEKEEVVVNRSVYDKEMQGRLIVYLGKKTMPVTRERRMGGH